MLDSNILIDAGTGVGDLTLEEMIQIDHIFISHSHLDHILSVPLLADAVMRRRQERGCEAIQVHALPETIDAIRSHLLNGVIWPDFTRLPTLERPVLRFSPIDVGDIVLVGDRKIEVLPANHTVPAVGYAVVAEKGWWVYTGDTGSNPALWARLRDITIAHLIIETAFSDDDSALASLSHHLCPSTVAEELNQLDSPVDVYITHMKPGEQLAIMGEIGALQLKHRVHVLTAGQRLAMTGSD